MMLGTTHHNQPTILACGMVVALISFFSPPEGVMGEIDCIERWYEQCLTSEGQCEEERCQLYCGIYDCVVEWEDCSDDPEYCPDPQKPTYDACACEDDIS